MRIHIGHQYMQSLSSWWQNGLQTGCSKLNTLEGVQQVKDICSDDSIRSSPTD